MMTENFYTAEKTAAILKKTQSQIKDLVRNGQLREFRNSGVCYYKRDEVDKLAQPTDLPEDGGDCECGGERPEW